MHTLAQHPPEGWQASLLASHAPDGVWAKWKAYRKARRDLHHQCRLKELRPDIVHIHTASDWSWYRKVRLLRIARHYDVPVVMHIHSGKFATWIQSLSKRRQHSIRRVLSDKGVLGIALSEGWRNQLSAWLGDLGVVANPVSEKYLPAQGRRDEHHLLLLGRRDPIKGHDFAIELAGVLREHHPHLRLSLTGRKDSPQPWVAALGWVAEEEKIRLLQQASVLLIPSAYEGQPMVMLEALACGLPVCASDRLVDVPEPVRCAPHDDVLAWAETITALLLAPPDAQQLQEAAQKFSIYAVAEAWKRHYEVLLSFSRV